RRRGIDVDVARGAASHDRSHHGFVALQRRSALPLDQTIRLHLRRHVAHSGRQGVRRCFVRNSFSNGWHHARRLGPHRRPALSVHTRDDSARGHLRNRAARMTEPALPPEPVAPSEPETSSTLDEPPLVPLGNPLRPAGAVVALLGLFLPFLLMTMDVHWALSVPVGLAGIFVAAWGILDFIGAFDDAPERSL